MALQTVDIERITGATFDYEKYVRDKMLAEIKELIDRIDLSDSEFVGWDQQMTLPNSDHIEFQITFKLLKRS